MRHHSKKSGGRKSINGKVHQSNITMNNNQPDGSDGDDDPHTYVYTDFAQVRYEPTHLVSIEDALYKPASKKLPAKLNTMLSDPGEYFVLSCMYSSSHAH